MRLSLAMPLAVLAFGTGLGAARAQSADQIINSLKPGAGMLGTTRGIRPAGPPPAAMHTPAPHAVHHAAQHVAPTSSTPPTTGTAPPPAEAPHVNLTVDFQTGSAKLTSAAMHTLDSLGTALSSQALAAYHFRIEGHTDTVGTQAGNKTLSEKRAEAVVNYLVDKFNVDRSRLEAVGMGESGLLVPTGAQIAEPRNRRVLVVNIGS